MKQRRRMRLIVLSSFVAAFVASFGAGAAIAAQFQSISQNGYYSTGATSWVNWAAVNTNNDPAYNHQAFAVTAVGPTNTSAPPFYAGAAPRIYRNGALYCADQYVYNYMTIPKGGILNPGGCYNTGQIAAWSSQGATRGNTGSEYLSFWTLPTGSVWS